MSNKQYVLVRWRDIAGISSADNSSSWFDKEQMMKKADELFKQEYTTIGEIVGETDDYIAIAATSDNDLEESLFSDASMIMKSVIISIDPLNLTSQQ